MWATFASIALALQPSPVCDFQETKEAAGFRWLDEKKDVVLNTRVQKAFAAELAARRREGVPDTFPYIHKIGVYRDSALVIIGFREFADSPPEYDWFAAFNYSLRTDGKEVIGGHFPQWRLVRVASMEESIVPDVMFSSSTCTECEATYLLSALHYDPVAGIWKLREWGRNAKGEPTNEIVVGSDPQYGEYLYVYRSLYQILDFDQDGFVDIATWIREEERTWDDDKLRAEKEWVRVYSLKLGRPEVRAIDGGEQKRIKAILCTNDPKHELCRPRKRT